MEKVNTGGPAFPVLRMVSGGTLVPDGGMSLRDWFAGQLAASMVSGGLATGRALDKRAASVLVESAYVLADALIAERDK